MTRCLPLLVALATAFGVMQPAYAESIAVPAVRGKTNTEAVALIESKGLKARTIEVAGPAIGRVSTQDPAEGTSVSKGALVTLRVGTKARVKTKMPDVLGQRAEEALETLTIAYDVHMQRTPGDPAQAGRVLRTEPAPGSEIWLRGKVMVFVVSRSTAASTNEPAQPVTPPAEVETEETEEAEEAEETEDVDEDFKVPPLGSDVTLPDVVGQQLGKAKKALKRLGLIVNVVRVYEAGAKKDEIVMQVPGGPADVFAGDVVWLRVAKVTAVHAGSTPAGTPTTPGDEPTATPTKPATGNVATPTLVGLDGLRASQEIVRRGLLPHPWYVSRVGQEEWKVIAQKDPPGTELPKFGLVHFRVALPMNRTGTVHMPYLYGLTGQQATTVLRGLGLPTKGRIVDAAGRVTLQLPQAGAPIAWGTAVTLTLGKVTDAKAAAALPLVDMVPPGLTPPVSDPKAKKKNVIDKVGDFFGGLFD